MTIIVNNVKIINHIYHINKNRGGYEYMKIKEKLLEYIIDEGNPKILAEQILEIFIDKFDSELSEIGLIWEDDWNNLAIAFKITILKMLKKETLSWVGKGIISKNLFY